MMKNSFLFLLILILGLPTILQGQDPTEIVRRADQKLRGTSSYAEITMSIVRPSWTREVTLKSWSMGNEFALIKITAPARDKGSATLKREKEIWSWQPSIDRVIKLPPSMMMQSWMGSDFTNDDLVQESSIVTDYEHRFVQTEVLEGRDCYVIELIPKPDAPVVWGRILIWISQEEYLQLKTAFYDEDDYLVNTMYGREVKQLGGKLLPSVLEMVPEDEPGNKTIITYQRFEFDLDLATSFFSIQNMKRVR